jgi:hypothetical protein
MIIYHQSLELALYRTIFMLCLEFNHPKVPRSSKVRNPTIRHPKGQGNLVLGIGTAPGIVTRYPIPVLLRVVGIILIAIGQNGVCRGLQPYDFRLKMGLKAREVPAILTVIVKNYK